MSWYTSDVCIYEAEIRDVILPAIPEIMNVLTPSDGSFNGYLEHGQKISDFFADMASHRESVPMYSRKVG